jgi:tRNA(Ile)-lysidine synthase
VIRLSRKLPRKIAVAVSGGCDSMAALDFLRRSHDVTVLHYNHGTDGSDEAEELVRKYCEEKSVDCKWSKNLQEPPPGSSLEDFWRGKRYDFFEDARSGLSVVTCHHLDDVVETWLFTAMNGTPYLIPEFRDCYVRPFLQTRKAVFEDWCDRKSVPYVEDASNLDIRFMRNFIRHEMIPKVLVVNPGIHKVLRKKLRDNFLEQ